MDYYNKYKKYKFKFKNKGGSHLPTIAAFDSVEYYKQETSQYNFNDFLTRTNQREICGDAEVNVIRITNYGELLNGRYACQYKNITTPVIWHTHAINSGFHPSTEDLTKVLFNNEINTSFLFTCLGTWRIHYNGIYPVSNKEEFNAKLTSLAYVYFNDRMYQQFDKSMVNNDLMNTPDAFNKVYNKVIIPYIKNLHEELKLSDFLEFVPGIMESARGSGNVNNLIQLNINPPGLV